MNNTLQYVYIDSRTRKPTDKRNKLTVSIPHGIDNCSRVALKSFSIANTFPNMINKKLQWVEFLQTGTANNYGLWKAALFEIDFIDLLEDQIYLDNLNLQVEVQTQLTNASGNKISKTLIDETTGLLGETGIPTHAVDTETPLPLTITYNADIYKFNLYGTQPSTGKHKIVVLYDDDSGGSLWTSMGFDKNKLMRPTDIPAFLNKLKVYTEAHPAALPGAELFNVNASFTNEFHLRDMYATNANTIAKRTIYASHASRLENDISEINICSDLAESLITDKNGVCIKTDILEKVVNNVPKYSYIHHQADTLYFHELKKNNINYFNIRLDNHDYKLIDEEIMPDWTAVLIFEQTHEIEYHKEDIVAYKERAYELGHPVLNR